MALRLDPVPQVWGITGNLGGGKTLSAVCLALYALEHGYFIVTNVTLDLDALSLQLGGYVRNLYHHFSFEDPDFDPFKLPTGSPRGTPNGKRVLVIMDECAEWVDQYTKTDRDPRIKKFLSWIRHSSKRSQDVILIVQRLEYLNKNIRLLISKWVVVDDLKTYRLPVVKMTIPFMGGWCMQRVFDRNRRLVQGPCIVKKSTIGKYYNTAECLNTEGATFNYEYVMPRIVSLSAAPFFAFFISVLVLVAAIAFRNSYVSRSSRLIEVIAQRYSRQSGAGVADFSKKIQSASREALRQSGRSIR